MAAPLADLRVLELCEGIAGPYAGGMMAALGASVVKAEPPGHGDRARRWGPFAKDEPHPDGGGLFLFLNGGKRSVSLDPRPPSGRAVLLRLAARADVILQDGPGPLAWDDIAALNPAAVLVTVSPFGTGGPYDGYAGAEVVYQALCGLAYITGEPSRAPLAVGVPLAQYAAGQLAFAAALTARYHGLRTGRGQEAQVSLLEAAVTLMEHAPAMWSYRKRVRRRTGNLGGVAGWGIYPCLDGYVGVISGLGEAYEAFLQWMGLTDPKFLAWAARTEYADEMHAAILSRLGGRNKREVFQEAQARGIPFGYVGTVEDLLASPQLAARGFFRQVEHRAAGRLGLPGPPFIMSDTPWLTAPAPRLGEHNSEVFRRQLGLAGAEVIRLRAAGVI